MLPFPISRSPSRMINPSGWSKSRASPPAPTLVDQNPQATPIPWPGGGGPPQAGRSRGRLEAGLQAERADRLVVGGPVPLAPGVQPPELDRVDTQATRQSIQM